MGETDSDGRKRVARQIEHFDGVADRYHEARQTQNHVVLKSLIWGDFLGRSPLHALSRARVLEAMCGYADGHALLTRYLPAAIEYEGFDFSQRVVDTLHAERPELKVWREDVTRFLPEAGRYDVVMLLGGLHHVWHVAGEVVGRLALGLRKGGFFISLEPTHGNLLTRRIRERIYARNGLFDAETERGFSVSELSGFFTAAGLAPVDVQYPGLLAYVLYYNPDAFPGLNVGGSSMVRRIFAAERPFLRTRLARALSFATLSLWQRPVA